MQQPDLWYCAYKVLADYWYMEWILINLIYISLNIVWSLSQLMCNLEQDFRNKKQTK